jgi:hypothetical protein
MRKFTESFPFVMAAAAFALVLLLKAAFDAALAAPLLRLLQDHFGRLAADTIANFAAIGVPVVAAFALVYGTYRYVYWEIARDAYGARDMLADLRTTGIALRNQGMHLGVDIATWDRASLEWADKVTATIKQIDGPDAEWFKTLDAVPAARVRPLQLDAAHHKSFREHDYRLVRLEELIKRYSVGVLRQ